MGENPGQLEVGAVSPVVNLIGMALRKQDLALRNALRGALRQMFADGSMDRLLKSYSLTPFKLKDP